MSVCVRARLHSHMFVSMSPCVMIVVIAHTITTNVLVRGVRPVIGWWLMFMMMQPISTPLLVDGG